MRICFFNDINFLGGGEIWVLRACRYLKSQSHHVSVICPHRSALQIACQREGVDVYAYLQHPRKRYPFYEALYHFLKDTRVDVLYCTVMGKFCEARVLETVANSLSRGTDLPRTAIILKAGLPPMGDLSPEYFGAGAGRAVRRLHVVSNSTKEAFIEWYPEMANGFIEVFYEGTDLSAFIGDGRSSREVKMRWRVPPDHKIVTCVARLVGMKGQSVLLRAIPDIIKEHPKIYFLIAGEGDDKDMLEELRDDLGLKESVRFTGHVEDVPSLLGATDILCHPSLNDGIPNSIIEAMSMSIPVIASDLPGIREVINDGVSGTLFRPNDVNGLKESLLEILRNEAHTMEMAKRSKETVRKRFNLRENLDLLVRSLQSEIDEMQNPLYHKTTPPLPKMKLPVAILFLMHEIRTGGEETELCILARYLDGKRFRMSVLSCYASDEYAPAFEKLGYCNIRVDTACHHIEDEVGKLHYIIEKIRREDIGIVVACQDPRLAYEVCKQLPPTECRFIEHGGVVEDVRRIPKDRTARYVGVSRQMTEEAAKLMRRSDHVVLIPSMVDTDEFDEPEWAHARSISSDWLRKTIMKPFGFSEDACVIVFVGRLDPKKRVEDLIQAARELQTDCPEAFFLIVGGHDSFNPKYAEQILSDAANLVEKHRMAFVGPRSDVPGILSACDILVLPSVGEGMAHVINEAGAAGLAVVATDDGAAREQLEDGKCGRIISPGCVDELVSALRMLVSDKKLRLQLGRNLRKKVRCEYSARVLIEHWHSLLTSVTMELSKPPRVRSIDRDTVLSFPQEIQVQTTTTCNGACVMCPYPAVAKEFPTGRMDESVFREILRQCASAAEITRLEPFLMNEPFTDPRIIDWIELAKSMAPQAEISITTNGSLVTPEVTNRLISSGLDSIWFSFNGGTKETYEKTMGIPFHRVRENIDYLLSVRPSSLRVCVNMIETKAIRAEIPGSLAYWKSKGIEVGTSPFVNRAGNVPRFYELNYMPVGDKPIRVCDLVFHKMFILYNGDVILCCMDWRRKVILGNVLKDSIRDIWKGEEYRSIRRKIVQRKVTDLDLCSTCSYTFN